MALRATGLVLLAALAAAPAFAEKWVPVGPPGGDVRSLAADPRDPRRIFLGTADGLLYRSDDGGGRWMRLSPGFPSRGYSLDEIEVTPKGAVVVGYWEVHGSGGGVALSTDDGVTFKLLEGMAGKSVRALALAPGDPNTVVAGAIQGVFRTRDLGRTWERISPEGHADLRNVESVAVDPNSADTIYVGTWHLPWKTTDGGATWKPIASGMIDDSDVFTMTIDKRDPKTVYATACSGIYHSSDAATRWSRIRGIPSSSRRTRAFAQDPQNPQRLYAGTTEGLWASDDGSLTWRPLTTQSLVVNAVLALPGGKVLLGTDGAGVVASLDGGNEWAASNTGFSERLVTNLAFAGSRTVAGVWGDRQHAGVLVQDGDGWRRIGKGLEGRDVLAIALVGGEVLAGTDAGLFVSDAASGQWRRIPTLVGGIEISPRVTELAVVGGSILAGTSQHGVLRSADGGATWTTAPGTLGASVITLAAAPASPGLVMAVTASTILRSDDAGETWSLVSGSLPGTHKLAFAPGNANVVFAATRNGLYRSADQARSWRKLGNGLPPSDITGIALHPDGKIVFASDFTYGGVFRSDDGGETWRRVGRDGLGSERVWTVAVDPRHPDRVLASSAAGGLHQLVPAADTAVAAAP